MLVFMIMSYFYKYVNYSVNGETSEGVPLQEANKENDDEKGTEKQ